MTSTLTSTRSNRRSDGRTIEMRIDTTPKRIRVVFDGAVLADSTSALLAFTTERHPEYLLPADDIEWTHLDIDTDSSDEDMFGTSRTVRSGSSRAPLGRRYITGPASDHVAFDFRQMDAWFEEDEQIWFHPRDPFRRVDVIESSRHIEITVNGDIVARSDRPRLVTETGLPARWYVPRIDVDWSQLRPSATTSGCQYKGVAEWWHAQTDDADQLVDVVWGYERPIAEAAKLAGLVCFYAEHAAVETVIDGAAQLKPARDEAVLNPSLGLANIAV